MKSITGEVMMNLISQNCRLSSSRVLLFYSANFHNKRQHFNIHLITFTPFHFVSLKPHEIRRITTKILETLHQNLNEKEFFKSVYYVKSQIYTKAERIVCHSIIVIA